MTESARASRPNRNRGHSNQRNTPTTFFQQVRAMGATGRTFVYKCTKGHVTKKSFPLGTKFDDEDETTCSECLKKSDLKPAYLVWAENTSAGAK